MSSSISASKLFQPTKVGNLTLAHRVVMAPLTRNRANAKYEHGELGLEYYKQRSSVLGTLIVAEGTIVAPSTGGYRHAPGITSDAQIAAWKKIVDAVHENGSFIYIQIWAAGRGADPKALYDVDPSFNVVAPSPIALTGQDIVPHELTVEEIEEIVDFHRQAALNAIEKAGFDGVEVNMANGYLLDSFLQDTSNVRTDRYGGSVENRVRFPLEVMDAVVKAIGQEKAAFRFSPWSEYQDMGRMEDPKPTFALLATKVRDLYPNLAYMHVIEPRISGTIESDAPETASNDFLRDIWSPRPFISAGGYDAMSAAQAADKTGDLIAFGRLFISNPDLPLRLKRGLPLTKPDRSLFYVPESPAGYIDYPFSSMP